jgi:hypothetical protein
MDKAIPQDFSHTVHELLCNTYRTGILGLCPRANVEAAKSAPVRPWCKRRNCSSY